MVDSNLFNFSATKGRNVLQFFFVFLCTRRKTCARMETVASAIYLVVALAQNIQGTYVAATHSGEKDSILLETSRFAPSSYFVLSSASFSQLATKTNSNSFCKFCQDIFVHYDITSVLVVANVIIIILVLVFPLVRRDIVWRRR